MKSLLGLLLRASTALVFLGVLWSVYDLVRLWELYRHSRWTVAFRLAAILTGLLAAAILAYRVKRGLPHSLGHPRTAFPIRMFCYAAPLGLLVPTIIQAASYNILIVRSVFHSGTLLALGLWVIVANGFPAVAKGPSRPWIRIAELVIFNLLLATVLTEAALILVREVLPTPILYDDSTAEARIRPYRGNWGESWNSSGYHDEEFFEADHRDYVVALLADSFGTGVVPFRDNFATVAERILRDRIADDHDRVAIHNFGVDGIDVPEYLYLLRAEALGLNPSQVVLCLFVGNDIVGMELSRERAGYRLQDLLVTRVAWRVQRVLRGLERFDRVPPDPDEEAAETGGDPAEVGKIAESVFFGIESRRLEFCNTQDPTIAKRYAGLMEALDYFKKLVGVKLLILVIPDEYQVNDELYERVLASKSEPSHYDREYPQERIAEWCRTNAVRCLDVLPDLREAERSGRTYALRDTHWNAYGNRVAGKALASALLEYAER